MSNHTYLSDRVERCLAERGIPGSVTIRATVPRVERVERGERIHFAVDYHGVGTAHLVLDEHELTRGTVGAPIERALAEKIDRARRVALAA